MRGSRGTYIHKVWISHSSGISLNRLSADLWPVQRGLAVLWLLALGERKGCSAAQLNGIYIRNISPQLYYPNRRFEKKPPSIPAEGFIK